MINIIKNYKLEEEELTKIRCLLKLKNRILYHIISGLFALFFISAPLAMCINLLIFMNYIYYLAFGISALIVIFFELENIIFDSILKRKLQVNFKTKYITIVNTTLFIILASIFFIVFVILVKEFSI